MEQEGPPSTRKFGGLDDISYKHYRKQRTIRFPFSEAAYGLESFYILGGTSESVPNKLVLFIALSYSMKVFNRLDVFESETNDIVCGFLLKRRLS